MLEPPQGRSSVVEQRPFKPKVVGSIPTAPTNHPSEWWALSKNARANKLDDSVGALIVGGTSDNRIHESHSSDLVCPHRIALRRIGSVRHSMRRSASAIWSRLRLHKA